MVPKDTATIAVLSPGFGVVRVGFDRFLKVGKRVRAIVSGQVTKSLGIEAFRRGSLVAFGRSNEITEGGQRAGLNLRYPVRRHREIQTLPVCQLKCCHPNDLALHVYNGAAGRSGRYGRGDLYDSSEIRNITHGRYDPV